MVNTGSRSHPAVTLSSGGAGWRVGGRRSGGGAFSGANRRAHCQSPANISAPALIRQRRA